MGKRFIVYGQMDPEGEHVVEVTPPPHRTTVTARELGRVEAVEGQAFHTPKALRDAYQEAVELGQNVTWLSIEEAASAPAPVPEPVVVGSSAFVAPLAPVEPPPPPEEIEHMPEPQLPDAPSRPRRGKSPHGHGG